MIKTDDPQVNFCEGGEGESLQVDGSGAAEFITYWLADGAGELGAADTADTFRFEGYGAGNLWVAAKLGAVPCERVGGDDKGVVILIPGIEARSTPCSLFADGGNAQEMVPAEKGSYSFVKYSLFQGGIDFLSQASIYHSSFHL